ncbi:MAG: HIT domain-containing protein [Neisseria sp.]|nr:HIT domain-containing protein [Neisseria sp.]
MTCPICAAHNETILCQSNHWRVIAVNDDPNAPAFCRVIWQAHVAEMTDLSPAERDELMNVVYQVEAAMRQVLQPTKINLASLGNVVPHLHWHVIARFADDACFPAPIWAAAQREAHLKLPENWQAQVQAILAANLNINLNH